jgi:hypothetical protein
MNWFRYILANSVYEDLPDSSRGLSVEQKEQAQECFIRLTDAALDRLKTRSPRTRRLRVSKGMLKQQLGKMGHQSCDDEILDAAVAAMNADLRYLDAPLRTAIRKRLWDEPQEGFQHIHRPIREEMFPRRR